jgi:hypothetical protein
MSGWIDIAKELPVVHRPVLVLTTYRDIISAHRVEQTEDDAKLGLIWRFRIAGVHCHFRDGTVWNDDRVTHWMPHPGLPGTLATDEGGK